MPNVVEGQFGKYTLLQSEFAQMRPIQILDKASLSMPADVGVMLGEALKGCKITAEQAWGCVLYDCAVNEQLFIRMIEGDDVVIRLPSEEDHEPIRMPLQNIFGAAERIMARLTDDQGAELWDAAERALIAAARSMRQ